MRDRAINSHARTRLSKDEHEPVRTRPSCYVTLRIAL
jgi:hypothetical protein